MSSEDWTDLQNDACVASYFAMLTSELANQPYNKAAENRMLQEQIGRSRGSIEFKLCNISAALRGFGLPVIIGYKPRFNFQMSLAEAVSRWLDLHPDWEPSRIAQPVRSFAEAHSIVLGLAPTLRNQVPDELAQMQAVAHRFDVAARDARNRALGRAGEERVFHHERQSLRQHGRDDLARRVRWVSQEEGDGAGYDIASFTQTGQERLIEVKTTNGWDRTPFHITRNELAVAEERQEDWYLFRLYDFARAPQAFELRPPLSSHVSLTATQFLASFQ